MAERMEGKHSHYHLKVPNNPLIDLCSGEEFSNENLELEDSYHGYTNYLKTLAYLKSLDMEFDEDCRYSSTVSFHSSGSGSIFSASYLSTK